MNDELEENEQRRQHGAGHEADIMGCRAYRVLLRSASLIQQFWHLQ
jgi:hypothetical protein